MLTIGPLTFPNHFIQGPLAGYTCSAFRELVYDFTPPAYCVTEMISAVDLVARKQLDVRYLHRSANEKMLCYQLSGKCEKTLSEAVKMVSDLGADLIDLNCGCPKRKIRKKRVGSAHLENPDRLIRLVEAMKAASAVPITVKVRLAPDIVSIAKRIEAAGADALIVHGRTWMQDYDVPCDKHVIKTLVESVSIPVIANGDVIDKQSADRMLTETGCAGVMISRGGTGKPWLFQQLLMDMPSPDFKTVTALFLRHVEGLIALQNEYIAIMQSRRLARYYFRPYFSEETLKVFHAVECFKVLKQVLNHLGNTF